MRLNQISSRCFAVAPALPDVAARAVMSDSERARCLLLADYETFAVGTIVQHALALRDLSTHNVALTNVATLSRIKFDPDKYDVIVFHYSIVIANGFNIGPALRQRLGKSTALKVLFIQDEYRWIDATAEAIRELGISVVFSVVNADIVDRVYHHDWLKKVRKESTLTGFVDEKLVRRTVPAYSARSVDVAYRARKVPYWLGSFAMEKWRIGEEFRKRVGELGLSHDISSDEGARLYGESWIKFLTNTKSVLGTESGASVFDFSGSIRAGVEAAAIRDPDLKFETVQAEWLMDHDGKMAIHVISPRMFEAAALRTLMINYPGTYSGRLIPWRHYVPLAKDHSNIDEVVRVIRDPERAERIIEAAYREVACNPENSFRAMVAHFDRVVEEELPSFKVGPRTLRNFRHGLELASWADFYVRRFGRTARRAAWRAAKPVLPTRVVKRIEAKFIG